MRSRQKRYRLGEVIWNVSAGEHMRTCNVRGHARHYAQLICMPAQDTSQHGEPHIGLHLELYRGLHLGTTRKNLKLDFMRVRYRALRHRRSAQLISVCAVAASLGLREQLLEDPSRFFRYGASHPSRKASTKAHCPQSLCTLLFLVHRLNVLPLK